MDLSKYTIPNYISIYVLASSAILLLIIVLGLRGGRPVRWPFYLGGAILAWLSLHLYLGARGLYARADIIPPVMPIAVFSTLALLLFATFHPVVLRRLRELGPARLIEFQTWRFLPEILILLLIGEELMPTLMTFTGRNLDILAPLTAAPSSYFVLRRKLLPKNVMVIWNFIAMAILTVTVFHGILSAPYPFRLFHTQPANIAVLLYPVVLLPIFMVSLAFTVHIVSIKLLLEQTDETGEYLTRGASHD